MRQKTVHSNFITALLAAPARPSISSDRQHSLKSIKDCNELLETDVDKCTYQYIMYFQGKVATHLIRSSRRRDPF